MWNIGLYIWWMYSPLIGCLPNDTSCQHYFVLDSESFCYGVLCLLSASKWIWLLIADYQVTAPFYIQRPLSKHFRNHQSTLSIHFTYISFWWKTRVRNKRQINEHFKNMKKKRTKKRKERSKCKCISMQLRDIFSNAMANDTAENWKLSALDGVRALKKTVLFSNENICRIDLIEEKGATVAVVCLSEKCQRKRKW